MGNQFSGQEKRKFKRVPVNFTVFYKVDYPLTVRIMIRDIVVNAIALDISEGGMAILTSYDIPVATMVTVKFMMLDDTAERRSKSIEVQGEVRYDIPTKEKVFRLGIRFIDTSPHDRSFIANFVKREKT